MALLVHLPLTGDLHNQGLANIEVTNNGATVDNNGKIGKCYSFDGTSKYISLTNPFTDASEISCSIWVKPLANTSTNEQIINIGTSSGWNNIRFGILQRSNNQLLFHVSDGTNNITYSCYSSAINLNEWIHIVCTYKNRELKMYLNGELAKTYSISFDPSFSGISKIGIGAAPNGAEKFTGFINDVKIFSHCLSQKEISELKKALILHYSLDGNNGTLANPNIMPNSMTMALGSANASTGTWRLAGSSNMTKTRVAITDSPIGSCYGFQNEGIQTVNDGSCYGIDSFPFETNAEYTISMWARIISGTEGYAGYNIYNAGYVTGSHSKVDKNYYVTTLPSDGGWIRCWLNFTTNSTTNRNIYIGITTGDTNVTTQMCGIKIEKGNKVSPWSPCPSDNIYTALGYDDGIEYDTSGYGNNGIKNNSPTYSIDSPRYLASTHLDGVNQTIQLPNLLTLIPDSIFTFNIWFKRLESEPSSKTLETILGGPSGFELETCSANNVHDNKIKAYSWGSGSFEFEFDKWNMLTMVSNGTNTLFYLNGELKLTGTYKSLVSGTYFIGSWKNTSTQNYKGYVSDAKIFATALSDTEIQKLYTVSASIDSNGNAYSNAFVE